MHRKHSGFTIVELVVVIILLGMVFAVVLSIHMQGWVLNKTLGWIMTVLYFIFLVIIFLSKVVAKGVFEIIKESVDLTAAVTVATVGNIVRMCVLRICSRCSIASVKIR